MLHILLVDDDATDRELLIDAMSFKAGKLKITEASNGQEAIDMLQASDKLPDLVILDLNMPVKDGRETLREIRSSKTLKALPVCILSTSSAHFDVLNAYESGANLFLVKPLDYKDMIEMTSSLLSLFGKFVTLPGKMLN